MQTLLKGDTAPLPPHKDICLSSQWNAESAGLGAKGREHRAILCVGVVGGIFKNKCGRRILFHPVYDSDGYFQLWVHIKVLF